MLKFATPVPMRIVLEWRALGRIPSGADSLVSSDDAHRTNETPESQGVLRTVRRDRQDSQRGRPKRESPNGQLVPDRDKRRALSTLTEKNRNSNDVDNVLICGS